MPIIQQHIIPCGTAWWNENIILPRQETNFIRNSIRFRGAITWNTLTNKETRAKTLQEFKRCLVKFDTDKMNFEPILATTKNSS